MSQNLSGLLKAFTVWDHVYVEDFVKRNPSKAVYEVYDERKWGPLHHAVVSNSLRCVKALLSVKDLNTEEKTEDGYTALNLAIDLGVVESIIKLLVVANPELVNIPLVNIANHRKDYPIHQAVLKNQLNTIKVMVLTLKRKNLPIIEHVNRWNETALMLSTQKNYLHIFVYLLANTPINFRQVSDIYLNLFAMVARFITNDCVIPLLEVLLPLSYDYDTHGRSLVPQLLAPMSLSQENVIARDWFLNTFYLVDENLERPLFELLHAEFKDQPSDEIAYDILFALHSDLSTEIPHVYSSILTPSWNKLYYKFYDMFLNNRDLFDAVSVAYLAKFKKFELESVCLGFIEFVAVSFSEFGYSQNNCLHFLERFPAHTCFDDALILEAVIMWTLIHSINIRDYFNEIFTLWMPFSVIASKTDLIDIFRQKNERENEELVNKIEDVITTFIDSHEQPPKLFDLSVAAVRKCVFSPKNSAEEDTKQMKLNRLMSLDVPLTVKNRLRLNNTNYVFQN